MAQPNLKLNTKKSRIKEGVRMCKLIFVVASATLLIGCSYNESKKNGGGTSAPQKPLTDAAIIYSVVHEKVLKSSCVTCHSKNGGEPKGINLENYENVFRNLRLVRDVITARTMPPRSQPQLTEEQALLIISWIDSGAREKSAEAPGPSEPPPPTQNPPPVVPPVQNGEVKFSQVNEAVFKPKCLTCHSASAGNMAGINLESYEIILQLVPRIESAINSDKMPLGSPLNKELKELLNAWIKQGARP